MDIKEFDKVQSLIENVRYCDQKIIEVEKLLQRISDEGFKVDFSLSYPKSKERDINSVLGEDGSLNSEAGGTQGGTDATFSFFGSGFISQPAPDNKDYISLEASDRWSLSIIGYIHGCLCEYRERLISKVNNKYGLKL